MTNKNPDKKRVRVSMCVWTYVFTFCVDEIEKCKRRNLSSRSRVEPTYTLTSVLFFSSEQIIVVQEWLLESNILYLYPNNKCGLRKMIIFRLCLLSSCFTFKHWTQIFGHIDIRQLRHMLEEKQSTSSLHYMRNVTCLHIVSHLHHQRFQLFQISL